MNLRSPIVFSQTAAKVVFCSPEKGGGRDSRKARRQGRWNHQGVRPASGQAHPMIRNVLVMAKSGLVLFSKEFVNSVAQV